MERAMSLNSDDLLAAAWNASNISMPKPQQPQVLPKATLLDFLKNKRQNLGVSPGQQKALDAKKVIDAFVAKIKTQQDLEDLLQATKTLPLSSTDTIFDNNMKFIKDNQEQNGNTNVDVSRLGSAKKLEAAKRTITKIRDLCKEHNVPIINLSWDAIISHGDISKALTQYFLEGLTTSQWGKGIAFYSKAFWMVLEFKLGLSLMMSLWEQNIIHYTAWKPSKLGDLAAMAQEIEAKVQKKNVQVNVSKNVAKTKAQSYVEWVALTAAANPSLTLPELTYPSVMLLKQCKNIRKAKLEGPIAEMHAKIALIMHRIQLVVLGDMEPIKSLSKTDQGVRAYFEAEKIIRFTLRVAVKASYLRPNTSTGGSRVSQSPQFTAINDFAL